MVVLSFVQLIDPPAGVVANADPAILSPSQAVTSAIGVIVGIGFTVMVYVSGVPTHEPKDGVTVTVLTTAVVPAFVAVNAGVLPLPEAPSPVAVLSFVQLKLAPVGELTNAEAGTFAPAQTAISVGSVIVGVLPMVIVYVC